MITAGLFFEASSFASLAHEPQLAARERLGITRGAFHAAKPHDATEELVVEPVLAVLAREALADEP
jgi:hypothetical protein